MSWKKEDLLAKAKLFFEKAFQEDQEQIFFGLYCAMGLELLGRSAISSINIALLAEPDRDQGNLMYALELVASTNRKSIVTAQVFNLCKQLINEFSDEHQKMAMAIINRRNEEVHTGTAAFEEYKTHQWIEGFYKCCKVLSESMKESIDTIFQRSEAESAIVFLEEADAKVLSDTKSLIAAHEKVFQAKEESERATLRAEAETQSQLLSHRKRHKVICPACKCTGTVEGNTIGKDNIENTEDQIIVRQSVMPTKFHCTACDLKLDTYAKLKAANIAEHFTHRIHFTPTEYYDLESNDEEPDFDGFSDDGADYYFSND